MNKVAIVVLLLLVVALGGVALFQSRKSQQFSQQLAMTEQNSAELSQAGLAKDAEISKLNRQIEKIREGIAELPELRGRVTQQQSKLAALEKELASARRQSAAMQSRAEAGRANDRERSELLASAEITIAQLPPPVRNKIHSQYPGAKIGEIVRVQEDGATRYLLEGHSANDRYLRAALDENGEIVEQELEMRFSELPQVVRRAAGQQLGRDGGMDMNQVWEGGQTRYQGNAEQDGREMHYVFSETGDLLRYETWVEQPQVDEQPR